MIDVEYPITNKTSFGEQRNASQVEAVLKAVLHPSQGPQGSLLGALLSPIALVVRVFFVASVFQAPQICARSKFGTNSSQNTFKNEA